eukprot:c18505_g1_i2.p1 GENE.c18505_g1_i2~~c18505_g1_i2.p1  ORF type:complete len:334 (+),score=34.31 c18505_g1_i2:557-1558(+)
MVDLMALPEHETGNLLARIGSNTMCVENVMEAVLSRCGKRGHFARDCQEERSSRYKPQSDYKRRKIDQQPSWKTERQGQRKAYVVQGRADEEDGEDAADEETHQDVMFMARIPSEDPNIQLTSKEAKIYLGEFFVCNVVWSVAETQRVRQNWGQTKTTGLMDTGCTADVSGSTWMTEYIQILWVHVIEDEGAMMIPMLLSKRTMRDVMGCVLNMPDDTAGEEMGEHDHAIECMMKEVWVTTCDKQVREVRSQLEDEELEDADLVKMLRSIHRRFGHPSKDKSITLLETGGVRSSRVKKEMRKVVDECSVCKVNQKPNSRPWPWTLCTWKEGWC